MLSKVKESGVNGVLMHEALVIESFDQWELYKNMASPGTKKH